MSARILWLTPKWPLPANDGARVATSALLRELTGMGHFIDLIAFAAPDEVVVPAEAIQGLGLSSARSVSIAPRGMSLTMALHVTGTLATAGKGLPATLLRYSDSKTRAALETQLGRTLWDTVVFDGLHASVPLMERLRARSVTHWKKAIYRAHNVESDLWGQAASRTWDPLRALAFRAQRRAMLRYESELVSLCAGIATVSDEDRQRFIELEGQGDRGRFVTVPIGMGFGERPPEVPVEVPLSLIFLGRLDWPPNREGLKWFLKRVWPEVVAARTDLRLLIAGSGDREWLRGAIRSDLSDRIEILGRVDSVEPLYRRCVLALAPVFFGSGTRVKAIEAARYGRACLSTALGVQGMDALEGRDYLRAEDEGAWIRALRALTREDCVRLGRAAWSQAKTRFDAQRAAKVFEALL